MFLEDYLEELLVMVNYYGIKENFLYKLFDKVIKVSGEAYPEFVEKENYIKKVIKIEEEKFNETIDQGVEILNSYIEDQCKTIKNFKWRKSIQII